MPGAPFAPCLSAFTREATPSTLKGVAGAPDFESVFSYHSRKSMPTRPDNRAIPSPALTSRALARLAPLPRSFYARDPRIVARELLGKLLIRLAPASGAAALAAYPPAPATGAASVAAFPSSELSLCESGEPALLAGRIVEAEAYLGAIDPAAHAYRGPTPRNAVLFGPPGHAYVYFIYGNHYCTNVSCQPPGDPGCVLLRALEPVCGIPAMAALRGLALPDQPRPPQPSLAQLRRLTSGPGRLSAALAITRSQHNSCDLCSRASGLYIADDGWTTEAWADAHISATPRIHVTRAPHHEWRYLFTGNPFVSGPRPR
jgi:DNA-3-methyladenine glycosylase